MKEEGREGRTDSHGKEGGGCSWEGGREGGGAHWREGGSKGGGGQGYMRSYEGRNMRSYLREIHAVVDLREGGGGGT